MVHFSVEAYISFMPLVIELPIKTRGKRDHGFQDKNDLALCIFFDESAHELDENDGIEAVVANHPAYLALISDRGNHVDRKTL